jgi:hypothetical protein
VEAIFIIEAQHGGGEADVSGATDELLGMLTVFQPRAKLSHGFLSPGTPWCEFEAV